MPEVNFALLQPVDVGALTQQGFATGVALVKHAQTQHALQNYLANPDDPQAYNALAAYDPQSAATILQQRREQQQLATAQAQLDNRRKAGTQAAGGDVQGGMATALSGGDLEFADALSKLDDAHAKKIHDGWSTAATLAYRMRGMANPQERAAYWAENRPILESQGVPPEVLNKIDPSNIGQLDGIIAQAQTVTQQIEAAKPQIVATQPGGGVAGYFPNTGDVRTLVTPNTGGQPFGAPAPSGGAHNPGGLKDPKTGGFRSFGSDAEGIAAQEHQLGLYFGRGLNTVSSIVGTYAPPESKGGDNSGASTNNYIGYVARRLGVNPNEPLLPTIVPRIAAAMREWETGHTVSNGAAHDVASIRAAAERAIAQGADPEQVKARAAAHGVTL